MIKCAQCGFDNSLGHLHCAQCKARLNLAQITRQSFLNGRKHGYLRKILPYILLAIIVGFALTLWPAQLVVVKISGPEFGKLREKIIRLQKGVAAGPVEFSEKEVNILFNHFIQEQRRRPDFKASRVSIYAGQVVINPKTLTIFLSYQVGPWTLDPITIGPFWFTYKITGRPERKIDGLRLVPCNGAIGHLPLAALGGNLGMTRLNRIFLPFKNARAFLSGLEIIEMKKGSITVFGAQ